MSRDTPGNYNGMTHAEAKQLAADVRNKLVGSHEHAQKFQPINCRVVVVILDDDDGSVTITSAVRQGANYRPEFEHRMETCDTSSSIAYLTGEMIGMASKHKREAGPKP